MPGWHIISCLVTAMDDMSTVDKFGRNRRRHHSFAAIRGPAGIGFKLTDDNQYDIQGRCLRNIGTPSEASDAATRDYVDMYMQKCIKDTESAVQESGKLILSKTQLYIEAYIHKRISELMTQMRIYINKEIEELKALNVLRVQENSSIIEKLTKLEETVTKHHPPFYRLAVPPHLIDGGLQHEEKSVEDNDEGVLI